LMKPEAMKKNMNLMSNRVFQKIEDMRDDDDDDDHNLKDDNHNLKDDNHN
jgi:hypothetical protein